MRRLDNESIGIILLCVAAFIIGIFIVYFRIVEQEADQNTIYTASQEPNPSPPRSTAAIVIELEKEIDEMNKIWAERAALCWQHGRFTNLEQPWECTAEAWKLEKNHEKP